MGRSERCTGVNLVNHYRQTGIKHSITYTQVKDWTGPALDTLHLPSINKKYINDTSAWVCSLKFDFPDRGEISSYGLHSSQKSALELAARSLL
jgi:hypothetical protein